MTGNRKGFEKPSCVGVDFPVHTVNSNLVCIDCHRHVPTLAEKTGAGQGMMKADEQTQASKSLSDFGKWLNEH